MILPPSQSLLTANPHFAALYDHLTTHTLTPTGLTLSSQTSSSIQSTTLATTKSTLVRDQILLQALEDIHSPDLNTDTIASYISLSQLPPDTDLLLAPELAQFRTQLPQICQALSIHLQQINSPTPTTSLSELSRSLVNDLNDLRDRLPRELATLSTTYTEYLERHVTELEWLIRDLERNKHGTEARFVSSRVAYLGNVAREIELKAQIERCEREKGVERGDVEKEWERLQVEEVRLVRLERDLEEVLGRYASEGGDVDVFRVLGARYAETEREIEVVEREIEELENKVWRG